MSGPLIVVPAGAAARLDELAEKIDELLHSYAHDAHRRPRPAALPALAEEYASIAWQESVTGFSGQPSPGDEESAQKLLERPLFILGAPRSGTSFMLSLLDAHPSLLAFPAEGTLLTQFRRSLSRWNRQDRVATLARVWIARFIHSMNIPPFWLLGRPSLRENPYLEFSHRVREWARSPVVRAYGWPYDAFLAVVMAFATASQYEATWRNARHWVEKTPLHEFYLRTTLRRFPRARFVHMVRDPRAVIVSRRTVESNAGGNPEDTAAFAREIGRSQKLALRNERRLGVARYRVVRYEDLVSHTQRTMRELADFAGIDFHASLLSATVTGKPVRANSSHNIFSAPGAVQHDSLELYRDTINESDLETIEKYTGDAARRLGYEVSGRRAGIRTGEARS